MSTSEREWVRSVVTGDRGWIEERDGTLVVVLDRPSQDISRPYQEREWICDRDVRPLNLMALAQAAFAADAVLCKAVGAYEKETNWLNLKDSQRIAWMRTGPQKSLPRRRLYEYVMFSLSWLAETEACPPSIDVIKSMLRIVRESAGLNAKEQRLAMRELIALLEPDA